MSNVACTRSWVQSGQGGSGGASSLANSELWSLAIFGSSRHCVPPLCTLRVHHCCVYKPWFYHPQQNTLIARILIRKLRATQNSSANDPRILRQRTTNPPLSFVLLSAQFSSSRAHWLFEWDPHPANKQQMLLFHLSFTVLMRLTTAILTLHPPCQIIDGQMLYIVSPHPCSSSRLWPVLYPFLRSPLLFFSKKTMISIHTSTSWVAHHFPPHPSFSYLFSSSP